MKYVLPGLLVFALIGVWPIVAFALGLFALLFLIWVVAQLVWAAVAFVRWLT